MPWYVRRGDRGPAQRKLLIVIRQVPLSDGGSPSTFAQPLPPSLPTAKGGEVVFMPVCGADTEEPSLLRAMRAASALAASWLPAVVSEGAV